MFPKYHLIISLIVILALFPIYKFWTIGILFGGYLIDFDHYLWYILRKRDFSLKKAYKYSLPENKISKEKDVLHIFHVWEFWVIMLILSFFNIFFTLVFIGMIIHLIMDFIDLHRDLRRIEDRAFSFFMWLRRH